MRITNSMMTNNILMGLNKNKFALSQLEQQMATGKKIQKPSEDPIVAVRAIKLRSNIREINQYKSNIGDALSWMSVTEQALLNINDILKRVRDLAVQGSNDTLGVGERDKIAKELEQLKIQIQQEGNVNYAGRFVFTGYKTDKSLIFNQDNNETYEITQSFTKDQIQTKVLISDTTPPEQVEVHRIRLAYEGLGEADMPVTQIPTLTPPALNVTSMDSTDGNAYEPPAGQVYFLKDTGELIFNQGDVNNVASFDFSYEKQGFKKNDLVPEHYFNSIHRLPTGDVTYEVTNDKIQYQVSYNQDVNVNTLGRNVITNDLIRDLEELIQATRNIPEDGSTKQVLLEDQLGKDFKALMSKIDQHMKGIVGEVADLGSRMNRLELTNNRLTNDNLNFTDLMSQNEDVDIAETVIKMRSHEVVYNASLMASAKIMQPSLLDFIR